MDGCETRMAWVTPSVARAVPLPMSLAWMDRFIVWPSNRGLPARSAFVRFGKGPWRKDSISLREVRRDWVISQASVKLGVQYTASRRRSTRSLGRLTVSRTVRGCCRPASLGLECGLAAPRRSFLVEWLELAWSVSDIVYLSRLLWIEAVLRTMVWSHTLAGPYQIGGPRRCWGRTRPRWRKRVAVGRAPDGHNPEVVPPAWEALTSWVGTHRRFAPPSIFQHIIIALAPLMSGMRGLQEYSNLCTRVFPVKIFRDLRCESLNKCGLVSERGKWGERIEAYLIRYALYPWRYRDRGNALGERSGDPELGTIYWWRCFIAAAQRRMKKPIQRAACWKGIAS